MGKLMDKMTGELEMAGKGEGYKEMARTLSFVPVYTEHTPISMVSLLGQGSTVFLGFQP